MYTFDNSVYIYQSSNTSMLAKSTSVTSQYLANFYQLSKNLEIIAHIVAVFYLCLYVIC